MSICNTKNRLSSTISEALTKPKKKRPDRLRPVKVRNAHVKMIEDALGGEFPCMVALIQYQDVKSKNWWPRKFQLDKPEGQLITNFILQEESAGNEVFDGETVYQVLFSEAEGDFKVWKSIERLPNDEAA